MTGGGYSGYGAGRNSEMKAVFLLSNGANVLLI